MRVVYSAPNKAHHYGYARELNRAGMLHAFVSGFPRFGPGAQIPELGKKLHRADHLQCLYLAALRSKCPVTITRELTHLSKRWIDRVASRHVSGADLYLHYSGCGLDTARHMRKQGGVSVMEAVNSHVLSQQALLEEEYKMLGLPWVPFHQRETLRRVQECEEANYILVPSEFVKKSFLDRGFDESKILKAPYPLRNVDGAASGHMNREAQKDVFRILFVGSISIRKGLRYLIEAFRNLKHPRKELWIVGPAASPSGLEGISIPKGVSFHGVLKGEDLQRAYQSASIFCLPTLEEGLALVLGEALANGVPVLTTTNSGAEDLFMNGREGVIVPIRNSAALQEAMQKAIDDPEWFATIRRHALNRAEAFRDRRSQTPAIVEALHSVKGIN